MFNHKKYLQKFVSEYDGMTFRDTPEPILVVTNASPRFEIIGIHKLTPSENVGKHNLFIDVVDKDGKIMKDVKIAWGWEGQRPGEVTRPLVLDKPESEPSGNLVIWSNQKIWAMVLDKPSDKVYNVHTQLPDEGSGNTYGHHSYYIVWMLVDDVAEVPESNQEVEELKLEVKRLRAELDKATDILESIDDLLGEWNK